MRSTINLSKSSTLATLKTFSMKLTSKTQNSSKFKEFQQCLIQMIQTKKSKNLKECLKRCLVYENLTQFQFQVLKMSKRLLTHFELEISLQTRILYLFDLI